MLYNMVCANKPFTTCCLDKYGKGYMLYPPDDHPDWGTKYYDNGIGDTGWWNKNKSGWFFKKEYIKPLIAGGAKVVI